MDIFTPRDRIKTACLAACIESGQNIDQIAESLTKAACIIRKRRLPKVAGIFGDIQSLAKSTGALGLGAGAGLLALTALGSGMAGRTLGETAHNIQIGRLPSTDEIKLLDEAAIYNRTAEEIRARVEQKRRQEEEARKPSARRMF